VRRLLNWETTNRSRVVKQADVLMLFFLFPDQFETWFSTANLTDEVF
jgi:trehalose/maltose hydrolase-like predicted phosphorylase